MLQFTKYKTTSLQIYKLQSANCAGQGIDHESWQHCWYFVNKQNNFETEVENRQRQSINIFLIIYFI